MLSIDSDITPQRRRWLDATALHALVHDPMTGRIGD
jgi:hypothetical protein